MKDSRRVRFLAAACDTVLVPEYHALRGLRIAWSRLSDGQRTRFLEQLSVLVGPDHPATKRVNAFLNDAFKPRNQKSSEEIAREARIRRWERRQNRPSSTLVKAVSELDPDERKRLAERIRRSNSG
jgi:hypothetical protein